MWTTGRIAAAFATANGDPNKIPKIPNTYSHNYLLKLAMVFIQIWRIEDLELRELHPSSFGQFYGGDCYLVLYTYKRASKLQYILYMWQVRH